MTRRVLLYEVNEVPWEVWDRYIGVRPNSAVAALLGESMQRTTVDEDPYPELMPWRSWPTFHRSMYTDEHKVMDQGQDPASFGGTPLWDVADEAGLPVGLFGLLQSWPPRQFRAGGFWVPDSFARDTRAFPPSLERFQEFNIRMTRDNSFGPTPRLPASSFALTGADLVRHGLTAWSAQRLLAHLVNERRDERQRLSRPTMQVLPCFDVFWWLHRRYRPSLSMFFTNHVASMMHRFWGDWMPGYTSNGYVPDPVLATFIVKALDLVDHQVSVMRRWVDSHPATVLVLASGIGQGPIAYEQLPFRYVVDQPEILLAALGLPQAHAEVAMYPVTTLQFADGLEAAAGKTAVESVECDGQPFFSELRSFGTSLSFAPIEPETPDPECRVTWTPTGAGRRTGSLGDLGIVARQRPGGENTAQHEPDGSLIVYGRNVGPDSSREPVTILDAAPSILGLLGLDKSSAMRGEASIFRDVELV